MKKYKELTDIVSIAKAKADPLVVVEFLYHGVWDITNNNKHIDMDDTEYRKVINDELLDFVPNYKDPVFGINESGEWPAIFIRMVDGKYICRESQQCYTAFDRIKQR